MKTLENNEILKDLLDANNNPEIKSELTETLGEKTYDLEHFYSYLSKKIQSVMDNHEDFNETSFGKDYHKIQYDVMFRGEDRISEAEVRRIIKELNEYLATKREILRAPFNQDIPYFRASYSDKEYYLDKIEDRSLSVREFEKMESQIDEYDSILSRSNRRGREFSGGYGDIILSLTNGKIYDVAGGGERELEKDYNSKRYYASRSGASAAGNIFAGKGSLVYMPSSRMDIVYPRLYFKDINGLDMTMCTSRGVVDESLPTIIKSGKVDLGVDAVFLSQKNHLEQGNARDLINVIETRGESLKDWPIYTYKIRCYDKNLEEIEKVYTFKTNMNLRDINFKAIGKECFGIERGFDVEETGSFIDNMVGIKKYNGKYVRLGQFGLVKEVFDDHPSSEIDKQYYDEIEIGDRNEILHKKVRIEPISSDYDRVKMFNGWILGDNIAYKNIKKSHNPNRNHPENFDEGYEGYYIRNKKGPYEYNVKRVCSEHGMEYDRTLLDDDVYYLIYEDDISKYDEMWGIYGQVNMEFEYYVPKTIFERYSIDYWKKFLSKKLEEKVATGASVRLLPETTQKAIALNYIRNHPNTIFTLQDSYDAGNCHPGTDRFIETFNIPERVFGKDLLNHKDLKKMLNIYDFRKIFIEKALGSRFSI